MSTRTTMGPEVGELRTILGTNPAAGSEISETVPTGKRWTLITGQFELTTDATAGNRTVTIHFDDGTNQFYRWAYSSGSTQGPSSTMKYNPAPGGGTRGGLSATGAEFILPIPNYLPLGPGFRVGTWTVGLVAGDNFGAPIFLVVENDT